LKFDLIDNVVYVVLALYSSHWSVYDKNWGKLVRTLNNLRTVWFSILA
jgi:hypothetical protein